MEIINKINENIDYLIRGYFIVATCLTIISGTNRRLYSYTLYGKRLTNIHPLVNTKFLVPKSLFISFYVLGLIVNSILFYKEHREYLNVYRVMFLSHVTRRLFEQLFLFSKLPKPSKMHIFAYLFGLSYYVATAIALNNPSSSFSLRPSLVLNFLAQLLQFYSHCRLSELRRDGEDVKNLYRVPKGGPFNFVLCPHYLAEILLYVSLCCNLNMVFLLVFVTVELSILGQGQKKWYRENFPRSSLLTDKAIIPFVF